MAAEIAVKRCLISLLFGKIAGIDHLYRFEEIIKYHLGISFNAHDVLYFGCIESSHLGAAAYRFFTFFIQSRNYGNLVFAFFIFEAFPIMVMLR